MFLGREIRPFSIRSTSLSMDGNHFSPEILVRCPYLTELESYDYPYEDLEPIKVLRNLEKLSLTKKKHIASYWNKKRAFERYFRREKPLKTEGIMFIL